jgi:hypothetical protein
MQRLSPQTSAVSTGYSSLPMETMPTKMSKASHTKTNSPYIPQPISQAVTDTLRL